MSKKPFKGNYLTLENVRVYYDEGSDSFHLTSKDKDIPKGSSFHLTLNQGKEAEMVLAKILQDKRMMPKDYLLPLPPIATYDPTKRYMPWNEIPLGLERGGKERIWNVSKVPHLLMTGAVGTGKSVLQTTIIEHCLEHPESWKLMLVNPSLSEFSNYHNNPNVISRSSTKEEATVAIQSLHDIMMDRYETLAKNNMNNFRDLGSIENSPRAIMMVIDEASYIFGMSGSKTTHGKREDVLAEKSLRLVESIARLGRAAGIHLVVSSSILDPYIFSGEFKANLTLHVSLGHMTKEASHAFLGTNRASRLQPVLGRGYFRSNVPSGLEEGECQFYYRNPTVTKLAERIESHGEQSIYETMVALVEAEQELDYRNHVMKMESVTNYEDMHSPFKPMTIRINDFNEIMATSQPPVQGELHASLRKKMLTIVGKLARQGKAVGISVLVG